MRRAAAAPPLPQYAFMDWCSIKSTGTTLLIRNSVGIALGYGLNDRGSIHGGDWEFLFTTASRTALGPTQPAIQWVPGTLSLGGKAAGALSWPLTSM
jgi:hypothetical protein